LTIKDNENMANRKKLIEVSLPLEAINVASVREKSIRHGHPSTLHLWWARRPLAACRAVLFSSLVDDPSEYMPDEESARIERERLFDIIEDLVIWENSNNEEVLDKAKMEIARSVARNLNLDVPIGKEAVREFLAAKAPPVLDPFAGGGSIPLEAQRLGLRVYASDLNPVAVLINKALIEIPPKFANMPPVHPPEKETTSKGKGKKSKVTLPLWEKEWNGSQGLAEDVRYYGKWIRDEAFRRIGSIYPLVTVSKEMLSERSDLKNLGLKTGDQLTVIAWIWARTVKCPNPACKARMPLARSFGLSTKKGKETWVEYKVDNSEPLPKIIFNIKTKKGRPPEGTVNRNGARCIACETPVSLNYIRSEGQSGKMASQLLAIVAESPYGRVYISPDSSHEIAIEKTEPSWKPDQELHGKSRVSVPLYGMNTFGDLFTNRQLISLTTFSDLIEDVYDIIKKDISELNDRDVTSYANAVATYLGLTVSRTANSICSLAVWSQGRDQSVNVFSRQALPMTWDFPEVNPFAGAAGDFGSTSESMAKTIASLPTNIKRIEVQQKDAMAPNKDDVKFLISTDPPYYDNVEYADLSDFFYVWIRRSLSKIYPDLFSTLLTPKSEELVATTYRFDGDKLKAESFFEKGLRKVFDNFSKINNHDYPITIYYAFKQTESEESDSDEAFTDNRASTGWETLLTSLVQSGFQVDGTWPMRTERPTGVKASVNALASSIILVCRTRPQNTSSASRREFLSALKKELAPALRELQQGSIAPVDLAQAAIGPGMAVYSRYSAVLEADGKPMSVRTALGLINQALDEFLTEQEGEYDGDTRWALTWFEQYGHNEAAYGVAETLSRAKNTSVNGLSEAGIVEARGGKVRLYRRDELDTDWDPTHDKRLTAWESAAHLIYALENHGEESASELLAKLGPIAEVARDLAYRLYTVCERKGWAQDALGYNMLVVAWPRLKELAAQQKPKQVNLL
jgi:putative DNA methylase